MLEQLADASDESACMCGVLGAWRLGGWFRWGCLFFFGAWCFEGADGCLERGDGGVFLGEHVLMVLHVALVQRLLHVELRF